MADDIKFVNMTPTANDMQFEKWLNYLINIISALYGIDPAEIGFPNRGGATGSRGGSTLNEADPSKKQQQSQNKGLQPLLKFIEDLVNRHIVSEYGDKYTFQFVGGDTKSATDKLNILKLETQIFKTVNEAREEQGKKPIEGGDIILDASFLQGTAQLQQEKQYEDGKQKERLQMMMSLLEDDNEDSEDETTSDSDADSSKPEVGTDAQIKGDANVYRTQTSNKGQGRKGEKSSDFKH